MKGHIEVMSKSVVVSAIGTAITYFGGIFFVDIMNLKYYLAGLIVLPITFLIGYTMNRYWVFK